MNCKCGSGMELQWVCETCGERKASEGALAPGYQTAQEKAGGGGIGGSERDSVTPKVKEPLQGTTDANPASLTGDDARAAALRSPGPLTRTQAFREVALGIYVGEPCTICGVTLTRKDLDTAVWNPTDKGRCSHKGCWDESGKAQGASSSGGKPPARGGGL